VLSLASKLVEPAKILIIVGIAYTLAATGWYVMATPAPQDAQAAPGAQPAQAARADVGRITARNLFGEVGTTEVAAAPQVLHAPETRLRLTLEGLFQADDPARSAAIVAERNQPGELFLVGDRLPGDAILAEVHQDRILLRRGTVYETLRFSDEPAIARAQISEPLPDYNDPNDTGYVEEPAAEEPAVEYLDDQAHATPMSSGPRSTESAIRETVQHYRERLDQDAEGTLSELGVEAVADDGAEGYRLGTLAQHPALRQAGLQSGDVILSVNGNPIGNVDQDRREIDQVLAQGSIRLEIQRGGRRFFITTSLQ
jgi:general secretion pathway protein C